MTNFNSLLLFKLCLFKNTKSLFLFSFEITEVIIPLIARVKYSKNIIRNIHSVENLVGRSVKKSKELPSLNK